MCHSLARDQPQPGSFFQRPREAEKRDPGNEVVGSFAEEVGHAPNCIMVEAINQSGARIFLGVNLEEIVAGGMKKISLRVFSALTSLVI